MKQESPPGIEMLVTTEVGGATLAVSGELDLNTAPDMAEQASIIVDTDAPGRLTLDFAGLTFCDSAGISVLVRLRQQCDERGWQLRIVNTQRAVHRMLVDFTGLGEYLNIE